MCSRWLFDEFVGRHASAPIHGQPLHFHDNILNRRLHLGDGSSSQMALARSSPTRIEPPPARRRHATTSAAAAKARGGARGPERRRPASLNAHFFLELQVAQLCCRNPALRREWGVQGATEGDHPACTCGSAADARKVGDTVAPRQGAKPPSMCVSDRHRMAETENAVKGLGRNSA